MNEPEPTELPINGVLDLHTFTPADVKDLVPTYLDECRKRGILQVRIIHGKGTGALRETVHAVVRRTPGVESFGLAPGNAGGFVRRMVHEHGDASLRAAFLLRDCGGTYAVEYLLRRYKGSAFRKIYPNMSLVH